MERLFFVKSRPAHATCKQLLVPIAAIAAARKFGSSGADADEVERKFAASTDIVQRIKKLRQSPAAHHSMIDVYFEAPLYLLTTRDLWLRLRNGTLELKWPAQQSTAPGEMGGIDYYRESTDTEVIKKCLQELASISISAPVPVLPSADVQSPAEGSTPTGQARQTSGSGHEGRSAAKVLAHAEGLRRHNRRIVEWLGAADIRPFATIRSRRSRYRLTLPLSLPRPGAGREVEETVEQPVNIDIDEIQYDPADGVSLPGRDAGPAMYQYSIGEVELLQVPVSPSQHTHHSAARRMEAVFQALAIPATPVRGKVLEYIARFRPEHYSALAQSGLLDAKLR